MGLKDLRSFLGLRLKVFWAPCCRVPVADPPRPQTNGWDEILSAALFQDLGARWPAATSGPAAFMFGVQQSRALGGALPVSRFRFKTVDFRPVCQPGCVRPGRWQVINIQRQTGDGMDGCSFG